MPIRVSSRWILVATTALLLTAAGCSSDEPASTVPSGQTSDSAAQPTPGQEPAEPGSAEQGSADFGPLPPLDSKGCIDVTSANLDLAVATNADQARAAADIIAGFGPPASVAEALEHFVGTGGVHFDDPDFSEYNARIDGWVKAVCPL
ncbi:hypothetical protein ABIA65_000262 [Mycolicibacterium sp. 624]